MEENNILTNEEVLETTEEVAVCGSKKIAKMAIGIGASVLVSIITYKYVIKPIVNKIKAKKELNNAQIVNSDCVKENGDESKDYLL